MTRRYLFLTAVAVLIGAGVPSGRAPAETASGISPLLAMDTERHKAHRRLTEVERTQLRWPEETRLYADAARTAWSFVERHYQRATGMVAPVRNFSIATIWDVGGMLAAVYAARGLDLIDDAEYTRKIDAMLRTLQRVTLYDDAVFNRAYDTRTGAMIRARPGTRQAAGWSATDVGRLLIWLKIVGTDPRFTAAAGAVVRRNDLGRVVRAGYLWGEDIDQFGKPYTYQEGRLGYEQYAAQGFALWGYRADKALNLRQNAVSIRVLGQELPADLRRWDRLTNEPFLLMGLEIGWDRETAALARRLLLAQAARYRQTGLVTLTGEDAIDRPPHYFYYYCVYANGKQFGIDVQGREEVADSPRWVSAKGAFAVHALMPTRYSWLALEQLRVAQGDDGWASGVYEGTGRSTGTANINTAAVILSAALVHLRGEPLLAQARRAHGRPLGGSVP